MHSRWNYAIAIKSNELAPIVQLSPLSCESRQMGNEFFPKIIPIVNDRGFDTEANVSFRVERWVNVADIQLVFIISSYFVILKCNNKE